MRVLFLNHNQERFGTYFRCYNLALALSKKGTQVTLICASGKNIDLLVRTQRVNPNFKVITLPRIKYHQYFTGQILRLFITILFVLLANYDILHAFTVAQPQIALPALIGKYLRGKKMVVDWDDLWSGGFADEHSQLVSKTLSYFETNTPRSADKITYVSHYLEDKIKSLKLSTKSVLIPNGTNPEQFRLINRLEALKQTGLSTKYKYLVCVGNTYFENSIRILFAALKHTLKKYPVKLIFVGQFRPFPSVQKDYDRLKNNIIIVGKVPFENVLTYLSLSDILLLPMENTGIDKARFPIRLGDYLCAGRPIVSNAVGEVKKILQQYQAGLISPVSSANNLAQNIQKVLADVNLAKTLSTNAQKAASLITWNNIAIQLQHVYENLIS